MSYYSQLEDFLRFYNLASGTLFGMALNFKGKALDSPLSEKDSVARRCPQKRRGTEIPIRGSIARALQFKHKEHSTAHAQATPGHARCYVRKRRVRRR